MDLSSPLRSLAPTLDSVVLEVLSGTESSLSLPRITDLAGRGSRQGLTLAMDRLVASGLVTATPANRGYMYALNREHVLSQAVLTAARARSTIIGRITEQIALMTPEPLHASLFGSFARREAGADSDIDVLFILPHTPDDAWHAQAVALGEDVHAWTGNRMEYIALGVEEFDGAIERGEPIVSSWMSDAVTLHGPTIESMIREHSGPRR